MCNYARLDIGVACIRYIIAFFATALSFKLK